MSTLASPLPTLSIVAPLYNEAAVLPDFLHQLVPVLAELGLPFEIICVDDGSRDDSFAVLQQLRAGCPYLRVVRLSRNFGKERALTAGLAHATGQAMIPMDVDLQDPPGVIPELVARWQQGFDVVLAVRENRDADTWLKRRTANGFYRFFNSMSRVRIPENTGDFRLMSRRVVDVVLRLPERNRFMKGLFAWAGFPTATVPYRRAERAGGGVSTWTYWRLWNFALDGITAFSTVPLRVWSYCGLVTSAAALLYALWIIVHTLFTGVAVPGYASVMVVMLFLGGVQLLSLGVIGEYVGRIYQESKQRPLYVVQETLGINGTPSEQQGSPDDTAR
jgi:polyisoprenyl-phosphate glycosyltransferase